MANITLSFTDETIQYPPNFYQYYQGDTVNLTITPTDLPAGTELTINWTGGVATYVDGVISETVIYDGVNPIVINKQLADTATAATKYSQVKVSEPTNNIEVMSYILIISNIITFSWKYIDPNTYMPLPLTTEVTEGMMMGVRVSTTGIPLYEDITFTITGDVTQEDYSIRFNSTKIDAGNGTIYFTFNEDDLVEGDENFIFQLNGYEHIENSSLTIPVIDKTPPLIPTETNQRPVIPANSNQTYLLSVYEKERYLR